jgi:hypothetical protein
MSCLTIERDRPFKERRGWAWQNWISPLPPPPPPGCQRGFNERVNRAANGRFSEWALANWFGHWALMIIGAPDTLPLIIYVYFQALRSVMSGLSNEIFSVHYFWDWKMRETSLVKDCLYTYTVSTLLRSHQCPGKKWCDNLQTVILRPYCIGSPIPYTFQQASLDFWD